MLCHPEPHPAVSYALRNAKSLVTSGAGAGVVGSSSEHLAVVETASVWIIGICRGWRRGNNEFKVDYFLGIGLIGGIVFT